MKFVIQRVTEASVKVDGKVTGAIENGFMVLIGIAEEDTYEDADKYVKKLINLRIFSDENDKMNLSLKDVGGQLLMISQFTLCGNCKKGNRPSFTGAKAPLEAEKMYEYIVESDLKRVKSYFDGMGGVSIEV